MAGIRVAVAALAGTAVVAGAAIALAEPTGPVQPGVTAPDVRTPATTAAPAPADNAELHTAAPQNEQQPAPYYRRYVRPKKTPAPTPTPTPREVHVGDLAAPVPSIVPDAVVDGVNHTNQDLQGIIKPTATPTPQPKK
jgi:hypothetical protein